MRRRRDTSRSAWLGIPLALLAGACLVQRPTRDRPEPAGVHEEWESIHLVSRGAALFKVVVLGTQMHSSISDQLPAVNATLKMAELALKIKEHVPRFYVHFAEVGSDPDQRNYVVSNARLAQAGFEARRGLDQGIRELLLGLAMLPRGRYKNV